MFILITPAHNEAEQVEGLVDCIRFSELKPDLWLIVDDNSDDGTGQKFKETGRDLDFLKVHRVKESNGYMQFHISEVLQIGIKVCGDLIHKSNFIGILDADIRFGPHYWLQLAQFLEKYPDYGIVSGVLCSSYSSDRLFVEPFQRSDNPRGGLRLINYNCFKEIGQIDRSRAWDSIMNVRCRLMGWKLKMLENVYALTVRPTNERYNKRVGAQSLGRRSWHLHHPFWYVIIRALAMIIKGDFMKSLHYSKGFLRGCLKREEKFPNKSIRQYYRYERSKEWIKMLFSKFFGIKNIPHLIPTEEIFLEDIYK